jgi:LPXTG-site transpeptidase (sortase) family protein
LDITHSVPVAHTYVWKLPDDLAPDSEVSFALRVQVAYALPSPTTALTNSAGASTTSPEADTENNIALDTNASTGNANPSISLSVSPSQVRTNQNATYKITVKNNGNAPATNVVVSDSFSTYLNLVSATTTKGTATTNTSTRRVTVTIDVLLPDETVTITVVGRVNKTTGSNVTVSNSASLTYVFGGSTFSRSSNVASFQIIVSSTLPGTGGIELTNVQDNAYMPAAFSAFLLLVLGAIAFGYAVWVWRKSSSWDGWYLKMGVLLVGAAVVFTFATLYLVNIGGADGGKIAEELKASNNAIVRVEPTATLGVGGYRIEYPPIEEPETLPDYPIPTPQVQSTPNDPEKEAPDTSPVNRIVIPALGLDTVVKYVPYDGLTWLIAGLLQEVAWMGDTSWPGLGGNTGLAGHVTLRNGAEGPFRYLGDLQAGERVYVYTEKNIYAYRVRGKETVDETDLSVLNQDTNNQITLITCTEWDAVSGFYKKRLIVYADMEDVEPVFALASSD